MITPSQKEGTWLVKCECCKCQTMAEIQSDKIVIKDRRHGDTHIAVITIDDLTRCGIIKS